MNPMQPRRPVNRRNLRRGARTAGIMLWSGFLAAALATMLCFAFIDPKALAAGDAPAWWGSRLHVYAVGFFFFWLVGLIAAFLAWSLAHPRARR
jgi:hypothetical protein